MIIITINHSIHIWIIQVFKDENRLYILNLENLNKYYLKYIQSDLEYIIIYIKSLWWKLVIIIVISIFNKKKIVKEYQ